MRERERGRERQRDRECESESDRAKKCGRERERDIAYARTLIDRIIRLAVLRSSNPCIRIVLPVVRSLSSPHRQTSPVHTHS